MNAGVCDVIIKGLTNHFSGWLTASLIFAVR